MQLHSDPPPNTLSNPSAPSSLPRALAIPLSIISTISYILLLPSYLVFQTTIYYTLGPPYPDWTLGTLLFTRGLGLFLSFQYRFGLPQPDRASAYKVPVGARRKGCAVECRPVAGIPVVEEDELRIGWMRQTSVKVVDVPGFMVWPESASLSKTTANGNANGNATTTTTTTTTHSAQGYAKAKPDEKIIYYLVGGGFISGHPLRTHLAWWSSKLVGVRLFGE
ncbi:hypothetical protein QFC22_005135 [Naganishia vaughanmartiniae]|uniref:Uncharacterized protein n=1 Tax=Naganishia vaughanmartiniae TaxID=1424756 RepID=A0ACC2WW38_9TREE|nr:hypothetical protein QFC22_005135 [Naganishia vaughanmartiniae]